LEQEHVAVGRLERDAGISGVAPDQDVPGAGDGVVDADCLLAVGQGGAVVVAGRGRTRSVLDVQVGVACAARHGDFEACLAGGHFDAVDSLTLLGAGKTGDGHAVLQGCAGHAAEARLQCDAGEGVVAADHDVPGAGGGVVDAHGLVVAEEIGSVVIARRCGQGALLDIQIGVARAAGHDDLQLRLTGGDQDAEVHLRGRSAGDAGHGHAVGQRRNRQRGRVFGQQFDVGVGVVALEHDVPGAGGGVFDGDRLVVSDLIGPVVVAGGRRLRASADVEIDIAGAFGCADFQLVLAGGNLDLVELLAAGRPGDPGDRNAVGEAGLGEGRRGKQAQQRDQDCEALGVSNVQAVHFVLLSRRGSYRFH